MACDKLLNNVNNKTYSLVLRFIGIDEKSYYLRNLLKSICEQMNIILNKPNNLKVPEKLSDLKRYFKTMLIQNHTIKLIVIIDSIESLSNKDNSFKLDWLPDYLNYNCKLILTLSSECEELVERFRRKYPDQNDYVTMSDLCLEKSNYVLRKFLNQNDYRLEKSQSDLIQSLVQKSSTILPLHLKLITDEILNWKSLTKTSECILKNGLNEMVLFFINKIEKDFGSRLVKHVLSK